MTLRAGGVSQAPWSTWNLGDHVGDDASHVAQNRSLLAERLGARPVFLQQVHGIDVLHLPVDAPNVSTADGCVTEQAGLACTMMVADCLPVLFTSADGLSVGAAHAGWRGLAAGVLQGTVAALQTLQTRAGGTSELMAWMGPCIGPQAFEVGDEVRQAFVRQDSAAEAAFASKGDKWLADLPQLARLALVRAGLGVAHIYGNNGSQGWCTVSNPSRYFSHRRDAALLGSTGRMAACVWREVPRP